MTIGQFLGSLEEIGILPQDAVQALREELAATANTTTDAREFAARLVSQGKLTPFQAKTIYRGKAHRLVCGRYLLRERLRSGGMGKAYRAVERGSDRIVGIKVIASRSLQNQQAARELQHDVEIASQLEHPNLVATYEMGVARGLPYLVVEAAEGKTFSKLIKKQGKLPVELAIRYAADIRARAGICSCPACRASRHSAGEFVADHRGDRQDSRSRPGAPGRPIVEPLSDERSTQRGTSARDIDFMAPEQTADLARVDRRSDVYSLGCTLYYLLIGRRMYRGLPVLERLLAHRDAPIPSLQTLRSDVPSNVDLVFQRLVAKQPERRYQTMTAVRESARAMFEPRTGAAAAGTGKLFLKATTCRVAVAVGSARRFGLAADSTAATQAHDSDGAAANAATAHGTAQRGS